MQSTRVQIHSTIRKALAKATILSAEKERVLLRRYHENHDKEAMNELILSHMPMIMRVASKSSRNPGVDINDLVQTATEGLLIAINRWSFEKSEAGGLRFAEGEETEPKFSRLATYAMWWMRILLTNTVIEQRGVIVRAKSPNVRKALFSIPKAINKLGLDFPIAGSDIAKIAAYLSIDASDIEEALTHIAGDVMLDEPVGDGNMLRGDIIADDREGDNGILLRLVEGERWDAVCQAIMSCSPRDRFIIVARYLSSPKWKLDRLSDLLNISRERIRQISIDSLEHIRKMATSDRRRPGRIEHVNPALIPLLRSSGIAKHKQTEKDLNEFASAIERANASSDPNAMTLLLKHYNIKTGTTRSSEKHVNV